MIAATSTHGDVRVHARLAPACVLDKTGPAIYFEARADTAHPEDTEAPDDDYAAASAATTYSTATASARGALALVDEQEYDMAANSGGADVRGGAMVLPDEREYDVAAQNTGASEAGRVPGAESANSGGADMRGGAMVLSDEREYDVAAQNTEYDVAAQNTGAPETSRVQGVDSATQSWLDFCSPQLASDPGRKFGRNDARALLLDSGVGVGGYCFRPSSKGPSTVVLCVLITLEPVQVANIRLESYPCGQVHAHDLADEPIIFDSMGSVLAHFRDPHAQPNNQVPLGTCPTTPAQT